ncbi:MAG TPA: AMP-binding protein [Bdellovibrionota bacterium]|nr:AMP-binding protein [Bdellovibrionota bacterium]
MASTPKPWLKHYPQGVPAEINPENYRSIVDVFDRASSKHGASVAYSNMGANLTYADMDRLTAQFAAFLQKGLGLKKGERIALQMPNLLQYPVALFGALRAGLIVVNTNPLYTAREMKHQFKDSGATAVVILANFASHLQEVLSDTPIRHVIITEVGDLLSSPKRQVTNAVVKYVRKMVPPYSIPNAVPFRTALQKGAGLAYQKMDLGPSDIAFLQYTGGTTGVSKGAMLTHRNLVANMEQISAWIFPRLEEGKEVVFTPLPLYHVFSLVVNCLAFYQFGGRNILVTNPRDIAGFIKLLRDNPFTAISGVNTLFNALVNHPEIKTVDFSRTKIAVAGATALQGAVARKWKEVTGVPIIEGYGMTEASPMITCNPVDGTDKLGTIGLPAPSTEVRLVDDDGHDAALGKPGEIWARGPQVMKGYWQRPEETADVVDSQGWLHTGDVGVMDSDGFFKIVDRKKDMILVSGFNVYPNEIEDVLATHPGVLESAAVGIPDEKSGEAVKVFVVKRDQDLQAEPLMTFLRQNLVAYKVPRQIEFRKELPKTNVGKILRRALREEATRR